ncbi:MAG: hypothetical protein CMP33_03925 [Rickettsiales bacterium]|nr:hypothetical protein [Rickettsiales bacterium]
MHKKVKIGVIGLGYVGFPLAIKLSVNFNVVGFDVNSKRVKELKNGLDTTDEVDSKEILKRFKNKLCISGDSKILKDVNIFIVTVPTPVKKNNSPDLEPLRKACVTVSRYLKKEDIVAFESTVYPGLTEEFCGKIIEKESKLMMNKDFFLGYSPERINPGDKIHAVDKITKVVSSNNKKSLKILKDIYSKLTSGQIFIAKNIKVAEAAKVIENSQRDINIAFVNEIAKISQKLNISVYDVLEASNTKWNFLPFYPGLVGGHCIGVDPYYISFKAKKLGINPEVILSGRRTNDRMSNFIAKEIITRLKNRSNILILGLTFKENVPDTRNSKIFDLVRHFTDHGHSVSVCDPTLNNIKTDFNFYNRLEDVKKTPFDALVLAVNHKSFKNIYPKEISKYLNKNALIADILGIWRKRKHTFNYWSL